VTLTYTMQDDQGAPSSSTVTVTITGTNDAPIAVADAAATTENAAITVDVLANDTDLDDGHVFTLTSATAPNGKGLASVANNQLVFTPGTDFDHLAAGATEVVTVAYAMQDDQGAESVSTLTITITGTNDAPIAVADTAAGTENQILTIDVLANDTDLDDGHVFTLTGVVAPQGKGLAAVVNNRVTFAPGTDFDHLAAGVTETVVLTYVMTDEHGATSASTVTITVTGTNDAPVAGFDLATTSENAAITIDVLANDTDVDDGAVLTVTGALVQPGEGSIAVVANQLVFTPGTAFDHLAVGDTATVVAFYSIKDEKGGQSAATVTITVTGTNDAPIAVADTASGTENQVLTVDVLANDTDLDDNHSFTLTVATAPSSKGVASVVNNQLVFTPGTDFDHLAAGAVEVVTLSYTMQDEHGATSSSTVTVTITGTNDAPVAVADTGATTENAAITVDVLSNDTDVDDGHVFTLTSAAAPSGKGAASVVNNQLVFTPGTDFDHLAAGATEVVTVSYAMIDEHGAESVSTLSITITGTNDAPVAVADVAAGTENQILTVDVLANDTDVDDGHVFTLAGAVAPQGKGLAAIVNNRLVYTPGTDFDHLAAGVTETVVLTYVMTDEHGATSASTVTVTITGTNDAPVADFDSAATTENAAITVDVLANDTDVDDGAVLTVTGALVQPGQGSVSVVANQLVFTPGADFDHLAAGDTASV
ncbi:MAG: tandem-95 repeat protein, partial [Rhodococcus sp. (in: high G+C Gram-positive bacteria)]